MNILLRNPHAHPSTAPQLSRGQQLCIVNLLLFANHPFLPILECFVRDYALPTLELTYAQTRMICSQIPQTTVPLLPAAQTGVIGIEVLVLLQAILLLLAGQPTIRFLVARLRAVWQERVLLHHHPRERRSHRHLCQSRELKVSGVIEMFHWLFEIETYLVSDFTFFGELRLVCRIEMEKAYAHIHTRGEGGLLNN